MNALQVVLFAAVAAVAFAQFDGTDFSAFGQQGQCELSRLDDNVFDDTWRPTRLNSEGHQRCHNIRETDAPF